MITHLFYFSWKVSRSWCKSNLNSKLGGKYHLQHEKNQEPRSLRMQYLLTNKRKLYRFAIHVSGVLCKWWKRIIEIRNLDGNYLTGS